MIVIIMELNVFSFAWLVYDSSLSLCHEPIVKASHATPTSPCSAASTPQVYFNQTEIDFSQFIKYAVKLPDITDFTMHYWFNLADASTTSTMFNYGCESHSQLYLLSLCVLPCLLPHTCLPGYFFYVQQWRRCRFS